MDIPIDYTGENAKKEDLKQQRSDEDIIYAPFDSDVRFASPRQDSVFVEVPVSPAPAPEPASASKVAYPVGTFDAEQASEANEEPGWEDGLDDLDSYEGKEDSAIPVEDDGWIEGDEPVEEEPAEEVVPKEEYDALQARYDRLMADWDNYRRRTSDELEAAKDAANRNLAEALLPTLDNFALAIAHVDEADPQVAGMLTGFSAIYRSLASQLEREGLIKIAPEPGEPFDMSEHQAIARKEGSEFPPDTVTSAIQAGYRFKGSLIRPALVEVAV